MVEIPEDLEQRPGRLEKFKDNPLLRIIGYLAAKLSKVKISLESDNGKSAGTPRAPNPWE
ncbi:TPA: hypothetical protein DIS56_01045 [Candidatus Saccharibacteria bacterium]|nr:hypothetical protein [Candidatus Saccharibacteria bacterium]